MATKIQIRRDSAASWTSNNPILSAGEIGFESDSYKFKIGDGSSNWNDIQYFSSGSTSVFTAGETLTTGDALYLKASDSKVYKADYLSITTANVIGFAKSSASVDNDIEIQTGGVLIGFSGLIKNERYYLGANGAIILNSNLSFNKVKTPLGIAIDIDTLLIQINEPQYIKNTDSHNIGDIIWSLNPNLSRLEGVLPFGSGPVSQSDFSELYSSIGDINENAWTDLGYSASGIGNFYPTPPPSFFPRAALPKQSFTESNVVIASDYITDPNSNHYPFHITRNGTPLIVEGDVGILSNTLTSGDLVYARIDQPSGYLYLATSESNAISGTVIDFSTGTGTGTVTIKNAGIRITSKMWGHRHSNSSSLSYAACINRNNNDTEVYQSGSGSYRASYQGVSLNVTVTDPTNDGTNGVPDLTNESRPEGVYLYGYIKCSHNTATGEPVTALRYDTGWVDKAAEDGGTADWTDWTKSITHNLNANMTDLVIKFFVSSDGTDANAMNLSDMNMLCLWDNATAADYTLYYGHQFNQSSNNAIEIQTGAFGVPTMDSVGNSFTLNDDAWYYRFIIYKPNILANYTGSRNTIINISGATDATVNIPPANSIDYPIFIKKVGIGTGRVLLSFNGSENQSGITELINENDSIELVTNGTYWYQRAATNIIPEGLLKNYESNGELLPVGYELWELNTPDCISSNGRYPLDDINIIYEPAYVTEQSIDTYKNSWNKFTDKGTIGVFRDTTNLIAEPEDMTTSWTNQNSTDEASDLYFNGSKFTKITGDNTATFARVSYTIGNLASSNYSAQVVFKRNDATQSALQYWDGTSNKLEIVITWATKSVVANSGTLMFANFYGDDIVQIGGVSDTTAAAGSNDLLILYPVYGEAGNTTKYGWATAAMVENNLYPTPYTPTTRSAGALNYLYTIPSSGKFSFSMWIRPWFLYNTTFHKYLMSWYNTGGHAFNLTFNSSSDVFMIYYEAGTAGKTLVSQQFDDGTSFDNLNQWLFIAGAIDLTISAGTGQFFKVYGDNGTSSTEDTAFSGTIDAFSNFSELSKHKLNIGSTFIGDDYAGDTLITDFMFLPDTLLTESDFDTHYTNDKPYFTNNRILGKNCNYRLDEFGNAYFRNLTVE